MLLCHLEMCALSPTHWDSPASFRDLPLSLPPPTLGEKDPLVGGWPLGACLKAAWAPLPTALLGLETPVRVMGGGEC